MPNKPVSPMEDFLVFLIEAYDRIRESYTWFDIGFVFVLYFFMLWWVFDSMSIPLRILFWVGITVVALYACSEKPK